MHELPSDPERLSAATGALPYRENDLPDVTIIRSEVAPLAQHPLEENPIVAADTRTAHIVPASPSEVAPAEATQKAPEPAPDLRSFLDKLADPDYQPPEYTPDSMSSAGFKAPDGQPAGTDGANSLILRFDYVDAEAGVICRDDGTDEDIYVDAADMSPFTQRLGRRKFAADVRFSEETGKATITAVHGVEPPYRGEPIDPENPPANLLIEGNVTEVRERVDLTGVLTSQRRPTLLPMMEVQIEGADQPVWLPRETVEHLADSERTTNPLPGDSVQVRALPRFVDVPGLGRVALPCSLAGKRDFTAVPTSFITKSGPERQRRDDEYQAETAALIKRLGRITDPHATAEAVNGFLASRLQKTTVVGMMMYDATELMVGNEELQQIRRAVAQTVSATEQPALLAIAAEAGRGRYPQGDHPVDQFLNAANHWAHSGVIGSDQSLLNLHRMTVADLGKAVERCVSTELLRLDSPIRMLEYPVLQPAIAALAPETQEQVINNVVANLETIPSYQILWTTTKQMINEIYSSATARQRHRIVRMVADSVRTDDDALNLVRSVTNDRSDRLASELLEQARKAIRYQKPAARERLGISDEDYQEHRHTALAVRQAFGLLGENRYDFLTEYQSDILYDLDGMNLEQAV